MRLTLTSDLSGVATERRTLLWVDHALLAALAVLAAAALLHLAGVRTWPWELVHHFVVQYGLAAAGVAAAAMLLRRVWISAGAVLLALYFGAVFWTAPMPAPDRPAAPPTAARTAAAQPMLTEPAARPLTLITNNVWVLNYLRKDLLDWIAGQPADVIALQEVDARLTRQLSQEDDGYPYRLISDEEYITRSGWHTMESIVLLSRYPIVEHRLLRPWGKAWQAVLARIDMGAGLRPWIVAIHPPSPFYEEHQPTRDLIFIKLAAEIEGLDGPVIVAGDFNATPYTPAYADFVQAAGLATFRRFPATYAQGLGRFGLPIDHVLVRGARLDDLHALHAIGSDHRPLAATIMLPGEEP